MKVQNSFYKLRQRSGHQEDMNQGTAKTLNPEPSYPEPETLNPEP